ncbi:hypothetical protein QBC35DRAFT_477097 [Podospora australis]|uniref:Uncharacterized protein n=1 Tax=Podospora australis TaxID=1536484 RepID=A0AAN7AFE6_9PEZI|nr:hypothetical protein QBC35DRAFT_477097 [Podospora australis]
MAHAVVIVAGGFMAKDGNSRPEAIHGDLPPPWLDLDNLKIESLDRLPGMNRQALTLAEWSKSRKYGASEEIISNGRHRPAAIPATAWVRRLRTETRVRIAHALRTLTRSPLHIGRLKAPVMLHKKPQGRGKAPLSGPATTHRTWLEDWGKQGRGSRNAAVNSLFTLPWGMNVDLIMIVRRENPETESNQIICNKRNGKPLHEGLGFNPGEFDVVSEFHKKKLGRRD